MLFSSLEPKRGVRQHFQASSPLNHLAKWTQISYRDFLGWGNKSPGHITKMAATRIYCENTFETLPDGRWLWDLICSQAEALPSMFKWRTSAGLGLINDKVKFNS